VRRQRNSLDDLTMAELRRRATRARADLERAEDDLLAWDIVGFCVCLGLLLAWAAFA
jgi:hypothetical protein